MSETTLPLATPTQGAGAPRSRSARVSLTALQIVLGLFYAIASALPKLIAYPSAAESFDKLGWGHTGMYIIGVLELAGGLALLTPLLDSVAAVALSALMVGAFVVNVTVVHGPYVATPLILMLPLALIAWARRGHTTELLRLVRRWAGRRA
ncbi:MULTISPECIES: DoxX family protein [unclassified Streptomyces]|uniref:DoxX family protein n=1 Tax=unclassified Streptomyces TaxID=2593676 RepID=UPI002E26ABEB